MTTEARGTIPNTAAFGARLALIRWQQGWNQKEAALACRLPQNSWREWELSGRMPRNLVEVADKIEEATGVPSYWIMTGRDNGGPGGGIVVTDEYSWLSNALVTELHEPHFTTETDSYRDSRAA